MPPRKVPTISSLDPELYYFTGQREFEGMIEVQDKVITLDYPGVNPANPKQRAVSGWSQSDVTGAGGKKV